MKCDNVFYILIHFFHPNIYANSKTTASLEASTNTSLSSIMSSSSTVTFLDSSSYNEVEEGHEAVLKCRVKNLASHHMVRSLTSKE